MDWLWEQRNSLKSSTYYQRTKNVHWADRLWSTAVIKFIDFDFLQIGFSPIVLSIFIYIELSRTHLRRKKEEESGNAFGCIRSS